jgi:peroxiredoxin
MKLRPIYFFLFGLLLSSFTVIPFFPDLIGKKVNDFSLKDTDGKYVSLKDFKDAKGFMVIFTCNHCPFARLYSKRMNELNKKYKAKGIPLIAVNPMDTVAYEDESAALMKKKAKEEKFNFPYLQDVFQKTVVDFGADHTPQAFIIWKENNDWIIRYSGSIDDNGEHPEKANSFLANAADELLSGKIVTQAQTGSFGCKIFLRK